MTDPIKFAFGQSDDCPPVELLAQTARAPEIERHLAACAHCQTELDLLREFVAAEPTPAERPEVEWIAARLAGGFQPAFAPPRLSVWDRMREWLSAAFAPASHRALAGVAALVLVIAGGLYLRQSAREQRPIPTADGLVWRSGGFASLSPSGDLSQAPTEFHWDAVSNAAVYHVHLMEVDRTVIWSTDSVQTTVNIPDSVRAQFKPGRAFHWHVTASNSAGQTMASSDLQSFHILVTQP